MKATILALTVMFSFVIASCLKNSVVVPPSKQSSSSVSISMLMKDAPSEISSIVAILSREGDDSLKSNFTILNDSAQCEFKNVPAGAWHLQVNAYDGNSVLKYTGNTDVEVSSGQTTPVRLVLNPATGSISIFVKWGTQDTTSTDMALQFDGESGRVVFQPSSSLQSQSLTVECTVEFDTLAGYIPILAQTDLNLWNQADGYGIVYEHVDQLVFRMAELPNLAFYAWTEYTPPLHKWVHLAFTYDRQYKCIYLDGQLVLKAADSTAIYYGSDGVSLGTAYVSDQGGRLYFKGAMDELRIWNYARTQEQIDSLMNARLTGNEQGLVGYWDFNQNPSDTYAIDRTGNGNNGQLVGGVKFVRSDSIGN